MLSPRTTRGNRLGLALLGIVLLAGGLFALGQGQGVFFSDSGHDRLLTATESRYAAHHGWFWIVLAIAAVVVTLVCLRWLIVQGRRGNVGSFRLEPDRTHGGTKIGADTLTDAVEDEIGEYPDVRNVQATLTGSSSRPQMRLTVKTARRADLPGLRARIDDEALPHLCHALEVDQLPVYLRLVLDTGNADRALS